MLYGGCGIEVHGGLAQSSGETERRREVGDGEILEIYKTRKAYVVKGDGEILGIYKTRDEAMEMCKSIKFCQKNPEIEEHDAISIPG